MDADPTGGQDCTITFVGTATVLLRLGEFALLSDPNFVRRGQWVHIGHGLLTRRRTEPAMTIDEPDPATRARNIAMAKVGVGQAGRFVSQNAVQLHGGIGMTEEYAVGHYFRRVMVYEHLFGDTAHHLRFLAGQVA